MDTDDLSDEAYNGIIIEAERFNHDLTLRFGLISYHCENEIEYLAMAKKLIQQIKKLKGNELLDIFFGVLPDEKALHATLDKILRNILDIEKGMDN